MKIRPDQIEGIRQQDQQSRTDKADKAGKAFQELLNAEVGKGEKAAKPLSPPPLPGMGGVNSLLNVQQVQSVDAAGAQRAVAEKVENLLDKVDDYAAEIESENAGGSLRRAHGLLDEIEQGVSGLKEQAASDPTLRGVVDELEVLSVTERIKFNRGDYL